MRSGFSETCALLLKIEGNVSRLRVRSAHLVGHLPLQPHSEGTQVPFTPGMKDEILRRAAFRQADTFEGCQLVDPSQHEYATADPGRVHHDPGNLLGQL